MSKRLDEIMDNYVDETEESLDGDNEIREYVGCAGQSIFEDLDIGDGEEKRKNGLGVAQLYSKDLGKFPILSKDKLYSLICRYKLLDEGNPEKMKIREKIINSSLRYAYKVSKRLYLSLKNQYETGSLGLNDLVQVGSIGLIEALDKYNPDEGKSFLYYASYLIKSKIYSYLKYDSAFFGGGDYNESRPTGSAVKWRKMLEDFYQKNMREPTDKEMEFMILDYNMKASKKFSRYYGKYYKYFLESGIQSLDEHFSAFESKLGDEIQNIYPDVFLYDEDDIEDEKIDENLEITLKDILYDSDFKNVEDQFTLENVKEQLDDILETFPEKMAYVIRLYFGFIGGKSLDLDEIGEKVGLSRERVRQIKEKGIRKLREKWLKEKFLECIEN